jgi:hypothetical protein
MPERRLRGSGGSRSPGSEPLVDQLVGALGSLGATARLFNRIESGGADRTGSGLGRARP